MRKNVATFSLLLAWLCANGALLDVVQVIAWGKMFAGYVGDMSVASALERTLDPARPCRLCLRVARAKKAAREQLPQAVERSAEKLLLAVNPTSAFILAGSPPDWPLALARVAPTRREAVPVPPPRA